MSLLCLLGFHRWLPGWKDEDHTCLEEFCRYCHVGEFCARCGKVRK